MWYVCHALWLLWKWTVCNVSCTAIALVFACVTYHALWLLLCLPVYYLMHSKCSRTDHCHIECAQITFVFAFVIVHAADCGCSCVCLCNVSWALTALVCVHVYYVVRYGCSCVCNCNQYVMHSDGSGVGMYLFVLYDCSCVCQLTMLCGQIALALARALRGALGMPLCWLAYMFHARGLLWCLHV